MMSPSQFTVSTNCVPGGTGPATTLRIVRMGVLPRVACSRWESGQRDKRRDNYQSACRSLHWSTPFRPLVPLGRAGR